jgi:tyrosyl-tRNA synthetase
MNFVEELRWRGLLHDIIDGTEEYMLKNVTKGYIGFDPTSDSLHIGSLVPIMILVHMQRCGHLPVALVGGATGMVGDPSGKSTERNLLSIEELNYNVECLKIQLSKFLDFESKTNPAEMVNNYDWFKDMNFLTFIRDVGKHITVNYMMGKDSVKNRLENGMSYTEFSYQLIQGYDFYWLRKNKNCVLQMGGSDQWGNITTGTELIRKMDGEQVYALTCPLVKKADGSKFGKSEGGNVWLDANKTSPYKFYQFWLNTSDEDARNYIKSFTLISKKEIEALIQEHDSAPHLRVLQKALAKDITVRVHNEEEYEKAIKASEVLFGKSVKEDLLSLSAKTIKEIFDGVPQFSVSKSTLSDGINIIDLLSESTTVYGSKSEARRAIQEGGAYLNLDKISDPNQTITTADILADRYLLIRKGKKNYVLIEVC